MPVVSGDELQLETWLRYALKRQEFEVYYQPKQTLMTGRIEGAEALIRWCHPEQGYISPGSLCAPGRRDRTDCAHWRMGLAHGL
jgi:sensor c-di-GMP phosphodiesterase-like protein